MTMPKVLNVRTATPEECIGAVPIWRGTKWGNRAAMRTMTGTISRKEAVARFEAWIRTQPDLMAEAKQVFRNSSPLCYCAPRACHGDVLVRIAHEE